MIRMQQYSGTLLAVCIVLMFTIQSCTQMDKKDNPVKGSNAPYAMVIHGGAGTLLKDKMTEQQKTDYIKALNAALDIGERILADGGTSLDAVENTIRYMEDSPLFNAGKGAVFTNAGTNEMDASIMIGSDLQAGAIGGVGRIKNPISGARAVLEHSEHVMMVGIGAETFAERQNVTLVDSSYFFTQRRWDSLQRIKNKETTELSESDDLDKKHGTVGAVALDKEGNIVAGTSTGGMTNKRYNRIGDSPIIGAGTYANNKTCGVSCTGHGEFFIRYAVAHDISSVMEYTGASVVEAGDLVINNKLKDIGATGGAIILDNKGNVAMPFNTSGMYRGYTKPGERVVKIFED